MWMDVIIVQVKHIRSEKGKLVACLSIQGGIDGFRRYYSNYNWCYFKKKRS